MRVREEKQTGGAFEGSSRCKRERKTKRGFRYFFFLAAAFFAAGFFAAAFLAGAAGFFLAASFFAGLAGFLVAIDNPPFLCAVAHWEMF
jgi:hypothetical protein